LEVRWLRPGGLPAAMIEWFSPVVEEFETREDTYLVVEHINGLSVKIRGGERLDIKVARGDRGVLDVPGRARGRTRSWTKWSFPIPPVPGEEFAPPDWVPVKKDRRIGRFPGADDESTCAVEVTEVLKGGEQWWTLGFEAAGHPETHRGTLDATAALLFSNPLPDGVQLRMANSISYSEWLGTPNRAQP
jgi:hypothetical protein